MDLSRSKTKTAFNSLDLHTEEVGNASTSSSSDEENCSKSFPDENIFCRNQSRPIKCSITNNKYNLSVPIPKGNSLYAQAKRAEYLEKNHKKAEYLYRKAIRYDERKKSAIKDLASLLHQNGRTGEACELLESFRNIFAGDFNSLDNLLNTLKNQIINTGNSLNKLLKLSGLQKNDNKKEIFSLFSNTTRVKNIKFDKEITNGELSYYCILTFNSHSSARKTLEGFSSWNKYKIYWVNINGEIISDAHYAKQKIENYRKYNPTFQYCLFERDPLGHIYSLPIDAFQAIINRDLQESEINLESLFIKSLYEEIF